MRARRGRVLSLENRIGVGASSRSKTGPLHSLCEQSTFSAVSTLARGGIPLLVVHYPQSRRVRNAVLRATQGRLHPLHLDRVCSRLISLGSRGGGSRER